MKFPHRLIAAGLMLCIAVGVLTFPLGGFYRSPLMWIHHGTDDAQPVDVFLLGATADVGEDGTFTTSCFKQEDRYYQSALLSMQKGLYDHTANVYAPYYRQACLSVYYMDDPLRGPYFASAYEDVRESFLWYLEHENQGRPFILAGFSQGADLALRLMEEFFDEETLQNQLVAAYLIGWRITEEDLTQFPHLQMAQGASDTGVIVSFNCEAPGVTDSIILPEGGYTYGINPLSWSTDSVPVPKEQNPGYCNLDMQGQVIDEIPHLTGCYRSPDRGTLILPDISPEEFDPSRDLFVPGCYHDYDLELFYRSVQKNVKTRVEAFIKS